MIGIKLPATSANLGAGFDTLGVALSRYNYVWMEPATGIEVLSKDGTVIPTGEDNLVYRAVARVYQLCGKPLDGLKIIQENNIPMARGMGSSSACIAAGIIGANELLGRPLTQVDLVDLAWAIEGHPDNTTPAILGGLTVSVVEDGRVYTAREQVSDRFCFVLLVPDFELKTERSRAALPEQYLRQDAVFNLSRSALMVTALVQGNAENLRVAVQDRLHQPFRAELIPHCKEIFEITYRHGSLGTYISGAGPCVMAIVERENTAYDNGVLREMAQHGITGWKAERLLPDSVGAALLTEEEGR